MFNLVPSAEINNAHLSYYATQIDHYGVGLLDLLCFQKYLKNNQTAYF